jgi:hypothetical protein
MTVRVSTAFVVLVAHLLAMPLCANADSASDMQELRAQVKALADQVKETQGQLKSVQANLDAVLAKKSETSSAVTGEVVAASGASVPVQAHAIGAERSPDESKPKWYVGGGSSYAKLGYSAGELASKVTTSWSNSRLEMRNASNGSKVFVGMKPSKYWGVEAGYADLGDYSIKGVCTATQTSGCPIGAPANERRSISARPQAYYLDALGYLPVKTNLSLTGRLGVYHWQNQLSATLVSVWPTPTPPSRLSYSKIYSAKDRGFSIKYGFGVQYRLDRDFSIAADWERYVIGFKEGGVKGIDTGSLSIVMDF